MVKLSPWPKRDTVHIATFRYDGLCVNRVRGDDRRRRGEFLRRRFLRDRASQLFENSNEAADEISVRQGGPASAGARSVGGNATAVRGTLISCVSDGHE